MSGSPTQHQDYNAFPKLDSPIVDSDGRLSILWYRFFINLWRLCGASYARLPYAQVVQENPTTGESYLLNSSNGTDAGTLITTSSVVVIVNQTLGVAAPADQSRPHFIPTTPVDQPHSRQVLGVPSDQPHPILIIGSPMDQMNMANIINSTLEL